MQKITTFLTFKEHGLDAVNFYMTIFKNSKLNYMMRDGDKLQYASLSLDGTEFMAMDGGDNFYFALGTSLFVTCEDQSEVDDFWDKLTADGGEPEQCGWLKDKFGVSWQIVPKAMGQLMMDQDPAKVQKVMAAMLQMTKIDVAGLHKAYNS